MDLEENGRIPFLGMDVIRNGCRLETTVYRKPTDKGLLLHYHRHVDARYKRSLLNTMLNHAFQLSSTWRFFHEESERLKPRPNDSNMPTQHIATMLEIRVREDKPPLVSQQCVVYSFKCGLCGAGYVGYTCRHLHQRIEEHEGSAIGNHLRGQHDMEPEDIAQNFQILRKCQNKFDCLIFEMFFYKRTETNVKQTVRFNSRQTIGLEQFLLRLFYFIVFHCIFLTPFYIFYHILAFATSLSILT